MPIKVRNDHELIYQAVQSPVTLSAYRQFKYEDHGIQGDNEVGNERSAEPGRVVANGNHARLRNEGTTKNTCHSDKQSDTNKTCHSEEHKRRGIWVCTLLGITMKQISWQLPLLPSSRIAALGQRRSSPKLPNDPITQFLDQTMNAVLIIDKPAGLTSHDVVNRVIRILQERSVGHLRHARSASSRRATAGGDQQSDPAGAVLHFTREDLRGTIRFGFATDTCDAEGRCSRSSPSRRPVDGPSMRTGNPIWEAWSSRRHHRSRLRRFKACPPTNWLANTPKFRSIQFKSKLKNSRLYRSKTTAPVSVPASPPEPMCALSRTIWVKSWDTALTWNRSRRTAVGEFELANAHTLEELDAALKMGEADDLFIHPRKLLPQFPSVTANDEMAGRIRSGRPVNLPELSQARMVKVFAGQRELIAIATRVAGTLFHAKIVLAGEHGHSA